MCSLQNTGPRVLRNLLKFCPFVHFYLVFVILLYVVIKINGISVKWDFEME